MNLFRIDPGKNFFADIVDTLIRENCIDGFELLDYIFILPSQQAVDELKREFFNSSIYLLPNIYTFDHVPQEKIIQLLIEAELFEDIQDIKPVCSAEEQYFFACDFVQRECKDFFMQSKEAVFFAKKLIDTANESKIFQVKLSDVNLLDMPLHFEQNYRILLDFTIQWERHLSAIGKYDATDHNLLLLSKLTKLIKHKALKSKFIIAGTTCSKPSTLSLVRAAYKNPNCRIILCGIEELSFECDTKECNPQFLFERLKQNLSIHISDIEQYNAPSSCASDEIIRRIFMQTRENLLLPDPFHSSVVDRLTILEADEQFHEVHVVQGIILDICQNSPDKKILVISNSPNFVMDLLARLKLLNLFPNTSYGTNLKQTKIYEFLWLIDQVFFKLSENSAIILALLKHEYFKGYYAPEFEIALRGHNKGNILDLHRHLKCSNFDPQMQEQLRLMHTFVRLDGSDFALQLKQLIEIAEHLSNMVLWGGELGNYFAATIHKISQINFGKIPEGAFFDIFTGLVENYTFNDRAMYDENIIIHNSVSARLVHADVVIMSSFNEKVFPDLAYDNSIIPKVLRSKLNLPTEDLRIGQQAFDVYCHLHKAKIYLTRAKRDYNGLQQESRWLTKLKLLAKLNHITLDFGIEKHQQCSVLDAQEERKKYKLPEPVPAMHLRPTKFSATEIEKMVKDPYYIYCKKILRLKELEPLDKHYNQADYGTLIHDLFEKVTLNENFDCVAYMESKILDQHTRFLWKYRILKLVNWVKSYNAKMRKENKVIMVELKNSLQYHTADVLYEISVKTDRIELQGVSFDIFDYKTTKPPTNTDVSNFFALQLQIGALAMSARGYRCDALAYIELRTDKDKPILHEFKCKKHNSTADLLAQTQDFLLALFNQYQEEEFCYKPQSLNKLRLPYNPYDHLARIV